jgi:hypothetical protein
VEDLGRDLGGQQRPGMVEAGTGQAALPHMRGETREGARGPVRRKENGPGPTEIEEFSIYSKEFQKEVN